MWQVMRAALILLALLACVQPAAPQAVVTICTQAATGPGCSAVTTGNPFPVTGTISVTFPTIGTAVPATGVYDAVNVAGTLRGWSGLSTGTIFPGAVAIVDASGNQVTTFGGAATTSNASSGVATSATNQVAVAWTYGFNGTTWDQLQVDASKNLKVTAVTAGADPCQSVVKTYTPISITTNATTRIVAPTSAKRTYVCYMLLTSAAADNVGIVEGTGGTCGSGTAGVIGGTTAANGPNFSANGGVSVGNGGYAVAATAGTNVDLCLITSAATPLAGVIGWVQAP